MNIGKRIHELRKQKRISIVNFAKQLNISVITASSWEKGDVVPDSLQLTQIAKALNVSVDTLLNKTEYNNDVDLLTSAYDDHKEKNKMRNMVIIIVAFLTLFIIGDTMLALIFKRSPLLSWKTSYLNGDSYVDKGLIMDSFYCINDDVVTFKQTFKLSGFKCPSNKEKNKINKYVVNIEDTSKTKSDFKCSNATELFYEDDSYEYYFECINSSYVIVTYYNDKKENVKQALENGKVTIKDLDEYNIKYIKKEKTKENEELPVNKEEYPKKESIKLKDSLTFYLHKNNVQALEITFKIKDNKVIAINNQNNTEKEIFTQEEVKSIFIRLYGSREEAKLGIITSSGNLYISQTEINYDYVWNDDIIMEKQNVQNVSSLQIEKASETDPTGSLIAINDEGQEIYLKENLT